MIRLMLFALAWFAVAAPNPSSAQTEPRVALVIGNAAYPKGPIRTALGDAGLVAEALRSVGFDVVEGGDLIQNDLRTALREFLARIEAAGPGATAFVYFSGYGLDFEGETYLVPIDARLERDIDIPLDAIRLSDLMRPLAATKAQARIVVLDAARELPFLIEGGRLSRGIGALEAPPATLIALSSAPGTFVEDTQGEYSPYAVAIVEMVREPGLDLDDMFARIRVRVHQMTQGRQTPWSVAELPPGLTLVPGEPLHARPPSAGAPAAKARVVRRAPRPMREIGPDEAYGYAIEEDSLPAYTEFVETYPRHPLTPRIYILLRERREAYAWRRARLINSPEAYWTYSRRYPDGIYAPDAERRLRRLSVSLVPPSSFRSIEFEDAPPPLRDEPVRRFDVYQSAPPPVTLIEPQARYFTTLPPPPRPRAPGFLPIPVVIPVAPRVAAPPPRQSVPLTALPQTQPVVAPTTQPATLPAIQPSGPDTRRPGPGTPPATATPSPSTRPAAPPAAGSGTPSAATTPPATTPPGTTPPAVGQPPSGGRTPPPPVSRAPGAPSPAVASPTPPRSSQPTAPGQPAGPTPPGATPPSAATSPTAAPSTTPGTKPQPSAPPASVTAPPSASAPPSAARTSPPTPRGSPASTAPAVAKPGEPPAKPNTLPRPELPPRTLPSANTPQTNPDQRTRPTGPGAPPAAIAPQNAPSTARPTPPASVTRQDPSPPAPSTGARPQGSPSAPPAASRTPPPPPPATAARPAPPPPAAAARPAPPPPPPPATAARPAPPPPAAAARTAPPPAAAARPAAPPPQQPAARAAPPPAAPAAAAKPATKPGEKPKCEIVNGVEVCKR